MHPQLKSMWKGHLGSTMGFQHWVQHGKMDKRPVLSALYHAGPGAIEFEKQEVNRMFSMVFIKPAQTELASLIAFAPKRDGITRLCVDYRILKAVTICNSYLIPHMSQCIDLLGDVMEFSTSDAKSGCWQVEIAKADEWKTASTSLRGLFCFTHMPFRLMNAGGTPQRTADVTLKIVKWQLTIIYLDDIVILSRTPNEHIHHVRQDLKSLHDVRVTLNLKKWEYFTVHIAYLGHVAHLGHLKQSTQTIDTIHGHYYSTTFTELRTFLELCNDLFASFQIWPLLLHRWKWSFVKVNRRPWVDVSTMITALGTLRADLVEHHGLALPR